MNFLIFILYYLLCTMFFGSIVFLVLKFLFKKKMFDISKYAEKEIDHYFHAYDDGIENLSSFFNGEEDSDNANSFDGKAGNGENIDPNKFRL